MTSQLLSLVVLAGALALIFYLSKPEENSSILGVRATSTEIYCWDCMGDELRTTQLTTDALCECGSGQWSYIGDL